MSEEIFGPPGQVLQQIEVLSTFRQDGTEDFPYIIMANLLMPERNFGFEILHMKEIEHKDFVREGFHFRISVPVPQAELWEATIPHSRYPSLGHRIMQFKGPSRDF